MQAEHVNSYRSGPTWEEADASVVPPEYSIPLPSPDRPQPARPDEEGAWSWPPPDQAMEPPRAIRPMLPRLVFGAILAALVASAATFLVVAAF